MPTSIHTKHSGSATALLVVGGLALAASFPPHGVGILAWGALLPALWLWYRSRSIWESGGPLVSLFLLTYALAFFWPILHAFDDHGILALCGLIVWPVAMTVPFAGAHLVRRHAGLALAVATLVAGQVAMEWLLTFPPSTLAVGTPGNDAGLPDARPATECARRSTGVNAVALARECRHICDLCSGSAGGSDRRCTAGHRTCGIGVECRVTRTGAAIRQRHPLRLGD